MVRDLMAGPYAYPVGDIYVSCDWECHASRNPPSTEPGTDFACAYGTPVLAPCDGYVHDIKTTNSGAPGRVVYLAADDGGFLRGMHFSEVTCHIGQRVGRGKTQVARSGASGYGSDWYYGPHMHQTLWVDEPPWPTPGVTPTDDFELYVGNTPTPQPIEEDDMGFYFYADPAGTYGYFSEGSGKARKVTKEEWDWRKAVAATAGGVPYQLVHVSQQWYDKAFAL